MLRRAKLLSSLQRAKLEQLKEKMQLKLQKSSLNHFTKSYISEGQEEIESGKSDMKNFNSFRIKYWQKK